VILGAYVWKILVEPVKITLTPCGITKPTRTISSSFSGLGIGLVAWRSRSMSMDHPQLARRGVAGFGIIFFALIIAGYDREHQFLRTRNSPQRAARYLHQCG